jgi:long-chain acyl-CoA synthetase
MKDLNNLCDLIYEQKRLFKKSDFLNYKIAGKLHSISNQEFYNKTLYLACALKEIGVKKGDRLANYSYQSPKWLIIDMGAILASMVSVPIFSNISTDNLIFQLKDSDVKIIYCDNLSIINNDYIHKSDLVIIYSNKNDPHRNKFKSKKLYLFDDLLDIGKQNCKNHQCDFVDLSHNIKKDDLATIIYTSGSTGDPKGVEITHQNLISQINTTKNFFPLSENDIAISYLPLAHIFERMVMMYYISQGIRIYFVDDVKNLGNYLQEFRPTLMTTVPRVVEKIYLGINAKINSTSFIKKVIAKAAINRALNKDANIKGNIIDKIYDKLIYKKLRKFFGSNMKMIICGGAMISDNMERFYRNIKINIYPGYGMTETSPVIATNCPKNYRFQTVGKLYDNVEARLTKDSELEIRGPNVMKAYHNRAELTKKIIDKNGWLKTGDLAQIDKDGYIKLIGRKKELFKTAYAKYVTPVPIEQKIIQELGFLIGAQIIAESRQYVIALLFPDFTLIQNYKKMLSYNDSDKNFINSVELNQYVSKKIDKINTQFDRWQQIKKFIIISDEISIETGEITPSMKLKRAIIEQKYSKIIDDIYNE